MGAFDGLGSIPLANARAIHAEKVAALQAEIDRLRTKSVPARVLKNHYLVTVECDHETRRDRPICACSLVDLGWHPSVGHAVEAWIDHLSSPAVLGDSHLLDQSGP